ncbi:accessory factor UbiK family protein [Segnochrobactrum spirostomi]|uniref:Accessory factor UbiK family protein n=1 Tax=Segnochrobactrum spirostomi TaxID=2608987 RepID=A0A6A7Y348_9HYPH|nr:accessory factor UbiK family protein [Segnochrobactrum spirostomi]MQT12521.1 accessory factor UbiK family protein [Segnochrobactrum spirostomi]
MTQTNNRIFDEFAKLATDAAAAAQGVRREVETAFRSQAERFLADMDVVSREDHEAVKALAAKARTEADALKVALAELEARVARLELRAQGAKEAVDDAGDVV